MTKDEHRYDDILHLPHHQSAKHPHMSPQNRAAQFAPFAALTGHREAVREAEAQISEDGGDSPQHQQDC